MIPIELENMICEYANIKMDKKGIYNYCNLCKNYKSEPMLCLDIMFYQINISFILNSFFNKDIKFMDMMNKSEILPRGEEDMNRYGWVINSIELDEWYEQNVNGTRLDYYEFLNKHFLFINERSMNICRKCRDEKKKIKMD